MPLAQGFECLCALFLEPDIPPQSDVRRGTVMLNCLGHIESDLKKVELFLRHGFRRGSKLVEHAANHVLDAGGKRLRPALLLLAARAAGKRTMYLIPLAASMELIHTATLVHDDVIDAAEIRRGRSSVNSLWSDGVSVVLGDYILSQAMLNLSSNGLDLGTIRIIAGTLRDLCEGEMLQIQNVDNFRLSERQYFRIIRCKTAKLMETCCYLGAASKNKEDDELALCMGRFGLSYGQAFQVVDDIADLFLDSVQSMKSAASDVGGGKITLPIIRALGLGNRRERSELRELLRCRRRYLQQLREVVRERGGVEYSLAKVAKLVGSAHKTLAILPERKRRPFEELSEDLLVRARAAVGE